jgi:hypothetical protein
VEAYSQEHPADSDLERIVQGASDAHSKLSFVADIFDDYAAFRHPKNLRTIAKWSSDHIQSTWVRKHPEGIETNLRDVIRLPELTGVDRRCLDKLKRTG